MEQTAEDRRFACTACTTKWYVPASRPDAPAPDRCGACGAALRRLDQAEATGRRAVMREP